MDVEPQLLCQQTLSSESNSHERTKSVSMLPKLMPLASVVLALGLAYLRLERIQYRQRIQDYARKALNQLRRGGLKPRHEEAEYVRQILLFADSISDAQAGDFPAVWGKVYRWVFCSTLDRMVSGLAVVISMFIIMIGSGHAVGRFEFLVPFFDDKHIGITLYLLMFFFGISVFLVLYGAHIDHESRKLIDKNSEQTEIFVSEDTESTNVVNQG